MRLHLILILCSAVYLSMVDFSHGRDVKTTLDCDFNGKPPFCEWEREWFGMRRAGWKVGRKIRNSKLRDEDGGKFLYFRAKSRPVGFVSRLKSPQFVGSVSCLSFKFSIGGSKLPYPDGLSSLKIYLVNDASPNFENLIYEHKTKTNRRKFMEAAIEINLNEKQNQIILDSGRKDMVSSHLIIETTRGNSKRGFVIIDDVKVFHCSAETSFTYHPSTTTPLPPKRSEHIHLGAQSEDKMEKTSIEDDLNTDRKELLMKGKDAGHQILRQLPAKSGGIEVMQLLPSGSTTNIQGSVFSSESSPPIGSLVQPERPTHVSALTFLPSSDTQSDKRRVHVTQRKKGRRRQKKKHRKHRKGGSRSRLATTKKARLHDSFLSKLASTAQSQPNHGFGEVFIEERPTSPHDLTPTLNSFERIGACDFIEYTQRLRSCFRAFFSILYKRPRGCRSLYSELELCLMKSAESCVPSRDVSNTRLEELILGTLRTNFQTRKVYCEEDGAFVFPKFAVAKLPIQCGPRYFIKLSTCGSPFSNIFNFEHGNPQLCKEYYGANECQRRTTAQECNFDSETMLSYGLSLQYQFAHNPFCLHLPFSAWWPDSD